MYQSYKNAGKRDEKCAVHYHKVNLQVMNALSNSTIAGKIVHWLG